MHKKRNNDAYIVGDSMLNELDERKMKKGNGNVKVRAHPGAIATNMLDYLKPISRKQPSHLKLHAGTNNIKSQTPVEILGNFERVKDMIANNSPETRLVISSLLLRNDNIELNSKIRSLNESLRKFCVDNDMTYVDNTNIGVEALQKGGLHLNRTGTIHLGMNFKQCMKSF